MALSPVFMRALLAGEYIQTIEPVRCPDGFCVFAWSPCQFELHRGFGVPLESCSMESVSSIRIGATRLYRTTWMRSAALLSPLERVDGGGESAARAGLSSLKHFTNPENDVRCAGVMLIETSVDGVEHWRGVTR